MRDLWRDTQRELACAVYAAGRAGDELVRVTKGRVYPRKRVRHILNFLQLRRCVCVELVDGECPTDYGTHLVGCVKCGCIT
jgi:hypothetical protein